ncbi:DUF6707 family protein [Hymenobacter puniceus]|uniref:DUF6707 family protein n=1 Tax=Hymenobacter sp. BT190 TaxID=2763505 RepID=UPI0016510DE7|nr:DUF6707 family protein [Hymenobacter sp. BT190]MBC6698745.1 hypothetical protein [Hymenobacter sp. BT190]
MTLDEKRNVLASISTSIPAYPRLVRLAVSLAERFKPSVAATLERTKVLAYWLYVYELPEICLQVCRLLNDLEFKQDYNQWTWVELTLALEWKLRIEAGQMAAAQMCVEKLQATNSVGNPFMQQIKVGALSRRLAGGLLRDVEIEQAELFGDSATATAYRLIELGEILFIQAQGGSADLSVTELEQRFAADLTKLRAVKP